MRMASGAACADRQAAAKKWVDLNRHTIDVAELLTGHHLVRRASGDHFPVLQEDHVVGNVCCLFEIMEDDAECESVEIGQFTDEIQQAHLVLEVQECGGFIQQQHIGLLSQAGCQPHALQLPTGEFRDRAVSQVIQPGQRQCALHCIWAFGVCSAESAPVRVASQFDDVSHCQPRGGGPLLSQYGEPPGKAARGEGADVLAVELHGTGDALDEPGKPAQKGGLPTAVGANERSDLTWLKVNIYAVHNGGATVGDGDVATGQ